MWFLSFICRTEVLYRFVTSCWIACMCYSSHPPVHMTTGLILVARKIPLGILKRGWLDDVEIYRTEVGCENVNWTQRAMNVV